MKYLGFELVHDRKKIIGQAKKKAKKYIGYIRGKIQTEDKELLKLIVGAYYRSILIYQMTPLYSAGAITRQEIDKLEAALIR